jgi:hypothetical protein
MKERLRRDGQVQARPKSAPGRTRKEDTMSEEPDPTDFEAVISHYNIGSLDRQQEIWDRAMPKEMADHMFAAFAHNVGLGPHPASTLALSLILKKHSLSWKKKIRTILNRRNQKDRSGDIRLFWKFKT